MSAGAAAPLRARSWLLRPARALVARATPARSATARPARFPGGRHAARASARRTATPARRARTHSTIGGWEPSWGMTKSTPTIMPRMPMKRVSSPTRMALSEMSTKASATAKAPTGLEQPAGGDDALGRHVARGLGGPVLGVLEVGRASQVPISPMRGRSGRWPPPRRSTTRPRGADLGVAGAGGAEEVGQRAERAEHAERRQERAQAEDRDLVAEFVGLADEEARLGDLCALHRGAERLGRADEAVALVGAAAGGEREDDAAPDEAARARRRSPPPPRAGATGPPRRASPRAAEAGSALPSRSRPGALARGVAVAIAQLAARRDPVEVLALDDA